MGTLFKEQIAEVLSHRKKLGISDEGLKVAAVLIPLFEKDGKWHTLLMKRTEEVAYHKGQISFPGGAFDGMDKSLMDTALREACEEVGLRAKDVEVLGELDDIPTTTSNFRVTPFVGVIPYPYPFRLNRREAQELIEVPFSAFTAPGSFETKPVWDGRETGEAYFVNYKNHVIWGATAKILKHLVDLLTGGASNQTIKRCLGTAHGEPARRTSSLAGELVEPQRFSGIDPSTSSG